MESRTERRGATTVRCGLQVGPEARLNLEPHRGFLPRPEEADGAGEAPEPQAAHAPIRGDGEPHVGDDILQLRREAVQQVGLVRVQLEERQPERPL